MKFRFRYVEGDASTIWWWHGICPDMKQGLSNLAGWVWWSGPKEGPVITGEWHSCWDGGLEGSVFCNKNGIGRGRGCTNAGAQGGANNALNSFSIWSWNSKGTNLDHSWDDNSKYWAGDPIPSRNTVVPSSTICDEPSYWDTETGTLIDPGKEDSRPPCTCICFDGWSGPTCAQNLVFTKIENELRLLQQQADALTNEMLPQLTVNAEASEEQLKKNFLKKIFG